MRLKTYCVTVMDHWTPMRTFWTKKGARAFCDRHPGYGHLFHWNEDHWLHIYNS